MSSEPSCEPIKVGDLVLVTTGPQEGRRGTVDELYGLIDPLTKSKTLIPRAMIRLPDGSGFFQTRVEWLKKLS